MAYQPIPTKNEDAASADADPGIPILAVRKGTPANTSGTDGDYEPLQMSAGKLWTAADVALINGVAPLMGAGNTGTGSLRVTLATDQAALTTGLPVNYKSAGASSNGDGFSNNFNTPNDSAGNPMTYSTRPNIFNGSTWDRMKSGGVTGMTGVTPQATPTGGASFLNIAAGQATTVVKASAGTLYSIILNSAATATNTTIIYDNASGAGTVIGRPAVTTATVPTTLTFGPAGMAFANGLTIITATANGGDMTVVYK